MNPEVKGLHHFTGIAGEPTENASFYVNTLGLRLVKKTVNHDAPDMYHLFYGDRKGTPGSSLTFFPDMSNQKGKDGAGMITELALRIPKGSIQYWEDRLEEKQIEHEVLEWHGKETLCFEDPDGLDLRLVQEEDSGYETWADSKVPEKHQIRGMHHIKIDVADTGNIGKVLEIMGLEKTEGFEKTYFEAEDGSGVELEVNNSRGRMGKGSVHHIAFKAAENTEELEVWRERLQSLGLRPSPVISRKYFTSTYCRMPSGVLFEFSTMGPGYTADESVEELGQNFVLPENLESNRSQILENLPEFDEDVIR